MEFVKILHNSFSIFILGFEITTKSTKRTETIGKLEQNWFIVVAFIFFRSNVQCKFVLNMVVRQFFRINVRGY